WLPSAIAGAASALALGVLVRRLPRAPERAPAHDGARDDDRRRLFAWAGGAAAIGLLAAIGGNALRAGSQLVSAASEAIRLPTPAETLPPIPASTELDLPGLAAYITPNNGFYRIDTALVVPELRAADWSLRIHGLVEQEVVLTWQELVALPLQESVTTLACVSNPVGGDLIGNAVWLGYPVRELLARAVPTADADMVLSHSVDGFTASTPLEALTDGRDAILAIGMNGTQLPPEHGFPVRMVVPGLYGYVSATKWLTELEVTRFDRDTAYWTARGWSERGPVKLQSRIDVPRPGTSLAAGDTVIAGVAWQQHVGVDGVEVQVDDGAWREATLASAVSGDTWVQWRVPWTAQAGRHRIRCRAVSATGERQTEQEQDVAPDGATGWHTVDVDVA
ncbi:MAG: molybdopterin-dependent oxidoreductase, partial [Microbacterium sp.]